MGESYIWTPFAVKQCQSPAVASSSGGVMYQGRGVWRRARNHTATSRHMKLGQEAEPTKHYYYLDCYRDYKSRYTLY